jgi:hypothetical protein
MKTDFYIGLAVVAAAYFIVKAIGDSASSGADYLNSAATSLGNSIAGSAADATNAIQNAAVSSGSLLAPVGFFAQPILTSIINNNPNNQ